MASMRGGQKVWNALGAIGGPDTHVADGSAVAQNSYSSWAYVGSGPNVAVLISNTGANNATFKVQVSGSDAPQAGLNAITTSAADGGLVWYDYVPRGSTSTPSLVVNAGTALGFDMSPFAPPFIRLMRTDSGSATTVNALVTCFGPN